MVRISDAELKVMKIVWRKKEVTSLEIINGLKDNKWSDNTVRTLINRLILKKAVGISKKEGKTYTYIPLIKENEYKIKKSMNFIEQLYDGSINDMILNFIDNKKIARNDLQELLDRIDKKIK